jgi:hypothetical protein
VLEFIQTILIIKAHIHHSWHGKEKRFFFTIRKKPLENVKIFAHVLQEVVAVPEYST